MNLFSSPAAGKLAVGGFFSGLANTDKLKVREEIG